MDMDKIARWAYIAFVAIAIIMGLAVGYMAYRGENVVDINGWVTLIMLVLGVIIGVTSITEKEVTPFLIVTIALIVASITDVWAPLETVHSLLRHWARYILDYIVAFAAPAAVITAIRALLPMAKEK